MLRWDKQHFVMLRFKNIKEMSSDKGAFDVSIFFMAKLIIIALSLSGLCFQGIISNAI